VLCLQHHWHREIVVIRVRKLFLALALAASPQTVFAEAFAVSAGHYSIEPSSRIAFTVGQMAGNGIAGSFSRFSGSFDLDPKNLAKSSVAFTLAPASVSASQQRITDFLRSSAVFDVDNHPSITFRSTRVVQTGPDTARIEGVLTARGKARNETFLASLADHDATSVAFKITGDIMRTPYGMGVGTPIYSNVVHFDMTLRGQK
jgi:polyisoprenoid-binding protein YceI